MQGEYKVYFKAILQCEPRLTHGFQLNWYISKISAKTTVVKGNTTADRKLDDYYDVRNST